MENYEKYLNRATELQAQMQGKRIVDPLFGYSANFVYDKIIERLKKVCCFPTAT
jgi:hypothetical protein